MNREDQIVKRREQIPKKYKGIYDRALKRGNLRAAVNAQCLECVGWVSGEVRKCTDLACPLYAHRQLNGEYCLIRSSTRPRQQEKRASIDELGSRDTKHPRNKGMR